MRGVLRALGVLILLVLLVGAGAITASRLIDVPASDNLRLVQLRAFTPYGLVLYGVLALIALGLLVRGLIRRRGRVLALVLLLVSALGLGAHVSWFLPQVSGANPPAASGAAKLTVMTIPMSGVAAADVVQTAVDEKPQILVLTQVSTADLDDLDAAGLAELLPGRAGEAGEGEKGSEQTMLFTSGEAGTAQPIGTDSGSFVAPVTIDDETLDVLAVDVASLTWANGWDHDQQALATAVGDDQPDLVVGNLSATDDHAELRALADDGYRSVTELANEGWRPTWPADRALPPVPLVQVDHVLCGSRMAAQSSRTLDVAGAEHRALIAEVAAK